MIILTYWTIHVIASIYACATQWMALYALTIIIIVFPTYTALTKMRIIRLKQKKGYGIAHLA